jgi:hypothetical protein
MAITQQTLIASAAYASCRPRPPVRRIRRKAMPASTMAIGTNPGRLTTRAATA